MIFKDKWSNLSRRTFLVGLATMLLRAPTAKGHIASKCLFGAIRWDAQYCDTPGQACFEEEKALGPRKWQFRAPLHSQVVGSDRIRFSPSQETFDAEISAASAGGLKYWAYLMYGKNGAIDLEHPMMKGLKYHRSSATKDQMNYAMMVTVDTLGRNGSYSAAVNAVVDLMRDKNYQTVLDGRPVLYFYYLERLMQSYWGGSLASLAEAVGFLRKAAQNTGLGNPYIIILKAPADEAEKVRFAIGADAISAYAITFRSDINATYPQLAEYARAYWEGEAAATSAGVIPTIMIGWDQRPRKEHPPAYNQNVRQTNDVAAYVTPPTPAEFADSCRLASHFIDTHPDVCASRLALIYAWNENSEGGALEPTIGDPSGALLAAASRAIR